MIWIIKYLLLFSLAVFVHELAHYVVYRMYGHKPDITLKWYGIIIGENVYEKIRLDRYLVILLAGPIAGLAVAVFDPIVLLIYLLACSLDLIAIFIIMWYDARGEYATMHTLTTLQAKIDRLYFWNNIMKTKTKWYQKLSKKILGLK